MVEKRRLKSNPIARELRTTKYKPHKIQNKKKIQERKRVKIKVRIMVSEPLKNENSIEQFI